MLDLLLNVSGWQEAAAGTLIHGLEILAVEVRYVRPGCQNCCLGIIYLPLFEAG